MECPTARKRSEVNGLRSESVYSFNIEEAKKLREKGIRAPHPGERGESSLVSTRALKRKKKCVPEGKKRVKGSTNTAAR